MATGTCNFGAKYHNAKIVENGETKTVELCTPIIEVVYDADEFGPSRTVTFTADISMSESDCYEAVMGFQKIITGVHTIEGSLQLYDVSGEPLPDKDART